ncbi:MAG: hypothetical protein NW215_03155 [Hyphomicrobiales bacterium]|nr:hypothetical protein [Hyphomicrobiales bacterium]
MGQNANKFTGERLSKFSHVDRRIWGAETQAPAGAEAWGAEPSADAAWREPQREAAERAPAASPTPATYDQDFAPQPEPPLEYLAEAEWAGDWRVEQAIAAPPAPEPAAAQPRQAGYARDERRPAPPIHRRRNAAPAEPRFRYDAPPPPAEETWSRAAPLPPALEASQPVVAAEAAPLVAQPAQPAVEAPGTAVALRERPARRRPSKEARERMKARAAEALRNGASVIKRNASRSRIEENYARALTALHRHIFDRKLEQLFFRPTVELETRAALPAVAGAEPPPFRYDGPVPRLAFNWAMSALPRDLKSFAFVDFRAQRGRAMMLAARRNFERIIGYEYDERLYDDLQMNVAQFPRSLMQCRNIDCVRGDLSGVIVPDQPVVIYFANAFRERFLSLIMSHVATSYRLRPRRMYLIFENPGDAVDLGRDEIFYRIHAPIRERALLSAFSPVRMLVYRSLA